MRLMYLEGEDIIVRLNSHDRWGILVDAIADILIESESSGVLFEACEHLEHNGR
jgi:hypothetical protein